VESIAKSLGKPAVATVGTLEVEPDQINVVPGKVVFTVDLRHSDLSGRRALEERIRSLCGTISQERRLGLAIRTLQEKPPVAMHPEIRALLGRAAKESGITATEMVSGAGHDAQVLAARCRVGMLFVPSIGGRSHCPEEATKPADIELGTRVLARSLELLAY
jgi:allantoate deiminase